MSSAPQIALSLTLSAAGGLVTAGERLTVTVVATQGDRPLANAALEVWGFGRRRACHTDDGGRCQAVMPTGGRRTGSYIVQGVLPGSQGGPVVANAGVYLLGGTAPPPTAVPLIYWGWDYNNRDPATEDVGPFGATATYPWSAAVRFDDTLLPRFRRSLGYTLTLPGGRTMPKPMIPGLSLYTGAQQSPAYNYADYTPQAVLEQAGDSYQVDGGADCPRPAVQPRFDDPVWQTAYASAVQDFAAWLRAHPELDKVVTALRFNGGFDDEAFKTKDLGEACRYYAASPVSNNDFEAWLARGTDAWRQAFPHRPLYADGFPRPFQREYDVPVGFKWNGAHPNSFLFTYHSDAPTMGIGLISRWWPDQPRAFESWSGVWFTSGGHSEGPQAWAGTLWMILPMLAQHADWLDFHPDHWESFRHVPWLGEFVTEHLGQQAETTPSVWIALREAAAGGEKEAFGGWKSDAYGDWSFFLYRPELPAAGGQSVPLLRSKLPPAAREESIWTNPFPTVEDRPVDNRVGRSTGDGNCCLYFDIDDGYRYAGIDPQAAGFIWRVRVVYLDQGTDTWALEYYDRRGHLQRHVVRKENTGTWRETVFELPDFYAANQWVGLNDFRLNDQGDGADGFVFIELGGLW